MKLGVAILFFSGLAVLTAALVILGGGKNMSIRLSDAEAGIGVPPTDSRLTGKFEIATFALG